MIDFTKNVLLEDDVVLLRPWDRSDVELLDPTATDPAIWKYTTSALSSSSDIRTYVAQALSDRECGKRYSFAICPKGKSTIVGSSSLGSISAKDRRIEIGWTWLVPEYHGRGINTRAKYHLLRHSFEELNVHRVEFKTDNANPRSCGALRKIGARRDGVLRSHTLMHDGRYRDTAYYSILEEEWSQVEPALRALCMGDRHAC